MTFHLITFFCFGECCRTVVVLILNVGAEIVGDEHCAGVTDQRFRMWWKLMKKIVHLAVLTQVCRWWTRRMSPQNFQNESGRTGLQSVFEIQLGWCYSVPSDTHHSTVVGDILSRHRFIGAWSGLLDERAAQRQGWRENASVVFSRHVSTSAGMSSLWSCIKMADAPYSCYLLTWCLGSRALLRDVMVGVHSCSARKPGRLG